MLWVGMSRDLPNCLGSSGPGLATGTGGLSKTAGAFRGNARGLIDRGTGFRFGVKPA